MSSTLYYSNGGFPGIAFSSGANWSETRRLSLRILRDLGMGRDHMETLVAFEALDLVKKLKSIKGRPLGARGLMNLTSFSALWRVLTDEKLEAGRLDKVWASLDKVFSKLTVQNYMIHANSI